MAMDFFEHQQQARQRTGLLLFYFFLAIFLTAAAINLVFFIGTRGWVQPGLGIGGWLQQPYCWWIVLATCAVIGFGSLSTWLKLRDGGHVIADTVGARRIDSDTTQLQERMLLNIVEEMAIASGTPAPTVYVMDAESGINAFVAGFEPTEAVLVVTKGALETFTRDEMQGVIGHEFSHILNGDMRMNVNLYALLAGILAIGRVGAFLMRSVGRSSMRSRNNKGAVPVVLIGLALMVIGYIGLFFGRLIKAAISRQREWLADASSIQFTRNPQGIGEALLKIRNTAHGSLLDNTHAEDMSHMCFALPMNIHFLSGLLATHPPIDERISAIDPVLLVRDRVRARRNEAGGSAAATPAPAPTASAGFTPLTASGGSMAFATETAAGSAAGPALAASVGQPAPAHLALASRLHASIPESIRDALRTPAGARTISYAIVVVGTDARFESEAQRQIAAGDSAAIASRLVKLLPDLRRMGTRLYLPCLDLALPALRTMSVDQKKKFTDVLAALTRLDQRLTIREFLVLALMRKHLADDAGATRPVRYRSYTAVIAPINTVLSLLCHATGGDDAARTALHAQLLRGFSLGAGTPSLLPASAVGAEALQTALVELAGLSPLLKKPLLDACIDGVSHDGKLQVAEIELVRVIGDALDCPIPPWAGVN